MTPNPELIRLGWELVTVLEREIAKFKAILMTEIDVTPGPGQLQLLTEDSAEDLKGYIAKEVGRIETVIDQIEIDDVVEDAPESTMVKILRNSGCKIIHVTYDGPEDAPRSDLVSTGYNPDIPVVSGTGAPILTLPDAPGSTIPAPVVSDYRLEPIGWQTGFMVDRETFGAFNVKIYCPFDCGGCDVYDTAVFTLRKVIKCRKCGRSFEVKRMDDVHLWKAIDNEETKAT